MLLAAAISLVSCAAAEKTGDVGNKNLRPYNMNDHERHGLPLNGVHSSDSPGYQLKSERHLYNHQDEWMLRNRMGNNWLGAHGNDHLAMDNKLARQIEALPGVQQAYVLVTEKNVYVGVKEQAQGQEQEQGQLSDKTATATDNDVQPALRRKITERVLLASPSVQQVLITSHPEYLERMKIYSDAERSGRSVKEYLAEFNALAARIFPAVTFMDDQGGADARQP